MREIIQKWKAWKKEHPDKDYQYDEIYNFVDGELSRGELVRILDFVETEYYKGCPTEEEYKRTGYPMVESLYCECGMTMIITNKIATEAPCLKCGKKNSYDDLLELGELPINPCDMCGSICVEIKKDKNGNVICPDGYKPKGK